MHHLPQRGGPIRKSLRPPLDMVERRRRERFDAPCEGWWPTGSVVRLGAASILCGCTASVTVALSMMIGTGDLPAVEPASAATMPARVNFRLHVEAIRKTSARSARTRAVVRERRHLVSVDSQQPTASPQPATPAALPQPAPTAPATPASPLSAAPWALTADGLWTTTIRLVVPAGIDPRHLDLQWSADGADVLPLDQNAPSAPGALVTTGDTSGSATVSVTSTNAAIGTQSVSIAKPNIGPLSFRAVALAVGPHLVNVGWAPLVAGIGVTEYKIYRERQGSTHGELIANVSPSGRTWHDASVEPNGAYGYSVIASTSDGGAKAWTGVVRTPAELPATSFDNISGKGMFLYFSPNAADANAYTIYDPDTIIERAHASGISHIEVRLARGTFVEAQSPGAKAWLDALIDKAAAAGIKLIAWQVPRRSTSADTATAVAGAEYSTPAGNGFAGLALDLEDGDNYMGLGEDAKQRMVDHIQMVRQAVGPDYLIVATVMSPALTHWTNARYPFARIAPYASVMQPMEYWHHFYSSSGHAYTQDEVTTACADSVALTRQQAERDIPINVAGQSEDLGTTGPPSPDEIGWCLGAAKSAGAIGQTFFDWRGTNDDDWAAIAGFAW